MAKRLIIMALFSVLMMASVAQAQETLPPVLAAVKGDIYAINPVDGSITQLTHHPAIIADGGATAQRDLAISADGHYLAYKQTPRFFAIAMKNNLTGNLGDVPSDIVVLDLTSGEERVIANQQPNVRYSDRARLWYRNNLVWSPDSSQFAYIQTRGNYGETNFQAQLMLYDPLENQTFTFVNGKEPLDEIGWLMEGIASGTTVWDIGGNLITHNYLNEGMIYEHAAQYQYNEYAIVDSADVIPHDGRVYLMNSLSGEYSVVDGIQSSVSDTSPDDSLVFVGDDNDTRPAYVINPKTGARFNPPRQAPYATDFTLAPDGQRFAYILLGTSVNISDLKGNELVVNLKADTIVWGRKRYTVASETGEQTASVDPTNDFHNVKRCGTAAPVALPLEGQGRVVMGSGANNIRKTPSLNTDKVGQIPEGATFKVVYGQQNVCSDGIRWAQVEYQGVTGWTAQGADGKAFLEPVQ